jgi:hypothetical protein
VIADYEEKLKYIMPLRDHGSFRCCSYRQNQTKTPNAAHNQAPAARNALIILDPSRSHANADKAKARPVTPVRINTHVAVVAGKCVARSSITVVSL